MKPLSTKSAVRQFRAHAERCFRQANPDAEAAIHWNWSRRVTFPTGYRGFTGQFAVCAVGYRPKTALASWVEGGGMRVS